MSSSKHAQMSEAEMELAQEHRKLKMMEHDKAKYTEETQNIIRKLRKGIDKKKEENEKLKEQLSFESTGLMRPNDSASQVVLMRLQDQVDLFQKKIDLERRSVEDLDKQSKILNVKLLELQQQRGGVNAARSGEQQLNKQIRILENRLEKALIKFNEALAYNKDLREGIDNLRRERVVFDGINAKLSGELHEKKKEMAQIIEISNLAYEARDQALNEMSLMRAHADKEQLSFENEWRDLGRLLEQDKKLKEKAQTGGTASKQFDDKDAKKGQVKNNWLVARDKASQKASVDRVQSFEEAFLQIKNATGIDNIDELVQTFIDAEDQNFSLFNYVNELNNEIEKLDESIAEVRLDIDKYKGQGGHSDKQRKKLLKDLEDRLAATEARAEQYDLKAQKSTRTVAHLEQGIQSIFAKIGCDKGALSETLGSTGVTETNMMQYLGVIEQRCNELMHAFSLKSSQQFEAKADAGRHASSAAAHARGGDASAGLSVGAGPQAPAGSTVINIEPPAIGDDNNSDDESDDDEERPMSRDELKAKTLRGMSKRDGSRAAAAKGARRKDAKGRR